MPASGGEVSRSTIMRRLDMEYRGLFFSLLGMCLAAPLLGPVVYSYGILEITTMAVLVGAVISSSRYSATRWVIPVLGMAALIATLASRKIQTLPLAQVQISLLAVFLASVAWIVLGAVLRSPRVTTHEVFGALSVYLLLGMIWVFLYALCLLSDAGALRFPEGEFEQLTDLAAHGVAMQDLTYFSFVTLSTLGYGDIVPVSPLARTLAWMEAVFGQLFLAVLVARLVASLSARPKESPK